MKKTVIIVVLLILRINFINAEPIDSAFALTIAQNFYAYASQNKDLRLTLAYTEKTTTGDTSVYFIFNVNGDQGWVIVSAENATFPILGYSLSGHYTADNLSPEYAFWMDNYKKQITHIKRNNILPTTSITEVWDKYQNVPNDNIYVVTTSVTPLLSTTWDQIPYYNVLCPGNCTTGCCATAMAQIMKYWNYPPKGDSNAKYTPRAHPSYGQLTADFGNTTYNWSAMPNILTSDNGAIDTLMFHCGVSVHMNYCSSGNASGAYVIDSDRYGVHHYSVQHALTTYFRYNPYTIQGLSKYDYSDSFWINNILKPELDKKRPIQYAATELGVGGHTWVCDGYDVNNLFHMNWGWSGSFNGYFNINKLNPSTYKFDTMYQAIIGIQPYIAPTINSKYTIYPNPANEMINIIEKSPVNGTYHLKISNLMGESFNDLDLNISNSSLETQINIKQLPNGIYILTISSGISNQVYRIVKM